MNAAKAWVPSKTCDYATNVFVPMHASTRAYSCKCYTTSKWPIAQITWLSRAGMPHLEQSRTSGANLCPCKSYHHGWLIFGGVVKHSWDALDLRHCKLPSDHEHAENSSNTNEDVLLQIKRKQLLIKRVDSAKPPRRHAPATEICFCGCCIEFVHVENFRNLLRPMCSTQQNTWWGIMWS